MIQINFYFPLFYIFLQLLRIQRISTSYLNYIKISYPARIWPDSKSRILLILDILPTHLVFSLIFLISPLIFLVLSLIFLLFSSFLYFPFLFLLYSRLISLSLLFTLYLSRLLTFL